MLKTKTMRKNMLNPHPYSNRLQCPTIKAQADGMHEWVPNPTILPQLQWALTRIQPVTPASCLPTTIFLFFSLLYLPKFWEHQWLWNLSNFNWIKQCFLSQQSIKTLLLTWVFSLFVGKFEKGTEWQVVSSPLPCKDNMDALI